MAKRWVYAPHSGGVDIPDRVREKTRQRILTSASSTFPANIPASKCASRESSVTSTHIPNLKLPPGWPPPDFPETREQHIERLRNIPTHLRRLAIRQRR